MEKLYSLTHPQRNLLFMEKFNPGTSLGVIAGSVNFVQKNIDIEALKRAINKVIELNDGFRLHFREVDGETMQFVIPYEEYVIEVIDFSDKSQEDYFSWEETQARVPFDIYENNLFYFAIMKREDKTSFYIKMHHLISDGWTMVTAVNEIIECYKALTNGREISIETPSYLDYVEEEEEYNQSKRFERSKKYWLDKFADGFEAAKLKLRKTNAISTEAKRKSYVLPEKLCKKLKEYSEKENISVFSIFSTAISMYIYRAIGKESFNFGTLILNRGNQNEKKMIGMFANTVAIKAEIKPEDNLVSFSKKFSAELMGILRNQKYPYDVLKRELREKFDTEDALFDIILSYQNSKFASDDEVPYTTRWHFNGHQTHSLTIDLNDRDNEGALIVSYDYLEDMFYAKEIEFLHDHIIRLLWHALDNPERELCTLEMVSQKEKDKILLGFNDTACEYPKEMTLDRIFEEQVKKTPDNVAVEAAGKSLTYAELNDRADKLAAKLRDLGVKADDIVGVLMYRSLEMIIGILAIHKAGAAYMPMDPDYPIDRVEYMLENSGAKLFLSHAVVDTVVENFQRVNVCNETLEKEPYRKAEKIHNSRNLAYVIYTSGSTGKPKGAMIEHYSAVNRINWMQKSYPLTEKDVILQKTPYTFDVSVWELVWWYFVGAKVCMLEPGAQKYPDKIIEAVREHGITTMHFVPSMLNAFLEYVDVSKDVQSLTSLRWVFASGEALLLDQVRKFNNLIYTKLGAQLVNLYGPTEATVDVSYFNCSPTPTNGIVPIGKPIDNIQLYVLDPNKNLLPIGLVGELYIAGDGLARGYVNNPTLTDEKFVDNPFVPGTKMYKTGDLARYMPKGDIEYMGRIDFQIKIRGFRIEIGEIETRIKYFKGINESVVIVREDKNTGIKNLCAYFTAKTQIDIKELKKSLMLKMPEYMVPSYYMQLDSMPLSANGKLDRKQLPEIEIEDEAVELVLPQTEEQKILAETFKKVLHLKEIGINQNFFELGADSLKVIGALTSLLKYEWNIGVQDFYQYPTIAELSDKITGNLESKKQDEIEIQEVPEFEEVNVLSGEKEKAGNVLLTGATGFLGSHILEALLKRDSESKIYCLVRSNKKQKARRRLEDTLEFYFNGMYRDLIGKRIFVVDGNIALDKLGFSNELYEELGGKIDNIIHSAASVKYYGDYEDIRNINVGGTRNLVEFAKKFGVKMNYISTITVVGEYLVDNQCTKGTFNEKDLYIGQAYRDNIYVRSKFESENLILAEMKNGLNATIYRMGNLTGRYSDGIFQKNIEENAFYATIRLVLEGNKISDELLEKEIEFTPIDLAAESIAKTFDVVEASGRIFHITNHNMITVKQFLQLVKEGHLDFKYVGNKDRLVGQIYLDEDGDLNYSSDILVESDITQRFLALAGFEWPMIDREYIHKIICYMIKSIYIVKRDDTNEKG